jgi:probable Rubsico expression protein CbbX
MSAPARRDARGFVMPRPGNGPAGAAPTAGGTDRARDGSQEAGADRQPGAAPDREPGARPDHGDREQLPADALVDLDEEGKALQISGLLERLDAEFVGLSPVKERVREIAALLLVDRLRARYALSSSRPSLHMCFTGSPGTGKTTMAMHMGELLHQLGYLRKGQLVTATRDDLVGQYVGHTAPKTKEVLKRAMGGVLLIDEAYYLYRPDNERDYGQEAIEILLQFMEAHRDDLVVILAGYKERMDVFFRSNPGMASRIGHHIDFPDFGICDLLQIAERMLEREEYRLSPEAAAAFREYVSLRMRQPRFAGARSIRNAIDRIRLRQAGRLVAAGGQVSRADLVEITEADVRGSRVFSGSSRPAQAAQPARLTGSDGLTGRGKRQDQPDRGTAAG